MIFIFNVYMADEFSWTMELIEQYNLNKEEYGEFFNSMTKRELEALVNYSGDGYEEINRSLRQGRPTDDAVALMNLFKRAPKIDQELTVFRAVTYNDEYPEPPYGDYIFKGIVSTTFDEELSGTPLDEDSTVLIITVSPGVRAIPWNEMGERELMLPDGIVGEITEAMDGYYRSYHDPDEYNRKDVWIKGNE